MGSLVPQRRAIWHLMNEAQCHKLTRNIVRPELCGNQLHVNMPKLFSSNVTLEDWQTTIMFITELIEHCRKLNIDHKKKYQAHNFCTTR